jgi:competence protein ComEA
LNDATPQWRSFSSDVPPGEQRAGSAHPADSPARDRLRWLAPLLAAAGGLAAGVTMAMGVALVAMPPAPPDAPPAGLGMGLDDLAPMSGAEATPAVSELVVDVAGAVARPGLHRLSSGSRVGDAIEAAGGFAPRADLAAASETLNLALPLEDGAKVLVPELGIDRPGTGTGQAAAAGDDRIELNSADGPALESLPGIGPVTAGKIIAARAEEPFESVRDLRTRGLVGEKVFEDIADLVRVG